MRYAAYSPQNGKARPHVNKDARAHFPWEDRDVGGR